MEKILEILKDYFTFDIPLGVVLIIIFIIIYVCSKLFKDMKSGFEARNRELRKDHKVLLTSYREKEKQQNSRISELEKMLDKHLKGGKKKWV